MADRARAAPARKRAGARRPAKKKRRRRLGIFGLALLTALILGFLTKRVMIPSAVHYIAYRAPDQPQPPAASQARNGADDSAAATAKSNADGRAGSEQLTPAERRELDAIIKRKSR